jgi:hypothetical protein
LVRAAIKHTAKGKPKGEKEKSVGGEGAVKRKREVEDEGEERPVKEFVKFSSSAPKRLHEVALAPPVLTKGPRGSGVGRTTSVSTVSTAPLSLARRATLEAERARMVDLYRALKRK